jgi:hypothetical protein
MTAGVAGYWVPDAPQRFFGGAGLPALLLQRLSLSAIRYPPAAAGYYWHAGASASSQHQRQRQRQRHARCIAHRTSRIGRVGTWDPGGEETGDRRTADALQYWPFFRSCAAQGPFLLLLVEEAYAQQGRARSHRLRTPVGPRARL